MSFINTEFFVFIAIAALVYYLMPKKYQWVLLLAVSYIYYISFGIKSIVFIIFTTVTTYIGGRLIESADKKGKDYLSLNKQAMDKDQKKAYKDKIKKSKRRLVVATLLLNFGLLAGVKYINFFIDNINSVMNSFQTGTTISAMELLLPIGISFYTFQSIGYIIDVYQGKVGAEKNPFKFALFVSFFPQIMQGPIGRFDKLAHQFMEPHKFNLKNMEFAIQRIGWGLFKKMVLADRTAVYVNAVFGNPEKYCGFYIIMALFLYTVQLYADFSGGIDIVIGTAQLFDIKLDENFRRPFFSRSVGEFWRRWHITLGTWMKDYIFYPFSLSKAMNKFGKFSKSKFGNTVGRVLPICLANLLIFFVVGIWHGAAWKFIAYGMYNGIIIAVSNLLEPLYSKGLKLFHINSESKVWMVFQILRTFILINIGWYFDMAGNVKIAINMMKDTLYQISFTQLTDWTIFELGMTLRDFKIVFAGCFVWFVISVLQEKGIKVREAIASRPLPIRWFLYLALIFSVPLLGYIGTTQGFIYAQF